MSDKRSKFGLGISLLILGFILLSSRFQKSSNLNQYTFANEPVEIKGFSEGQEEKSELPKRITIPKLSVDLEVREAEIIEGYWEVFPDSANWGDGSGIPGKPGNQVIFAHAREGLFLPLKNIRKGMEVYILTENKWFGYRVEETKEVYPDQVEVITPTSDETLTLYTCSGFQDTKRLIVTAKRI